MAAADDDELSALRRRAYGVDPNIHDDADALNRLRAFESGRKRDRHPEQPGVQPDAPAIQVIEQNDSSGPIDVERCLHVSERAPSRLVRFYLALRRTRRSSVLIGVGVLVATLSLLTAMILVQRVQVDPLQVGATQVARLSVDPDYATPTFFTAADADIQGFELFHGLRTLVSPTGLFAGGGGQGDMCLSVFAEADMVAARSDAFSGMALGGCAAGAFPASIQFRTDAQGYPDELRAAFPEPAALQFVYDEADGEVVVFVAPG